MKIRLDNGLILGGEEIQIQSISGLETPAVRTGSGIYAGADGGYVVSQFYGTRTIVVKGFFIGRCSSEMNDKRQSFLRRLPLRYIFGITIEDFEQQYWYTEGYVSDIKCEITAPRVGEYQITILCPDPLIYHATGWLTNSPVVTNQSLTANGQTTFLVGGNAQIFPTYRLTGDFSSNWGIRIGEDKCAFTRSWAATMLIDMKERTAKTEDNVSILQTRTTDSVWLPLNPGAVTVEIFGLNSAVSASVYFKEGFRGI